MPWGKQSWRQVCTVEAARSSCTPPHMTTRPLHVHLPAPLTANRHRKKTPNAHNLVLGWGLTSHSATSQSSRPTSALDTLHYLRQASFVIVALVEVGNNCAVSVSCSGCGGGGSSHQPSMGVQCQQSQGPGHPYSLALEPAPDCSWALLCLWGENWPFWGLRVGMEIKLEFLKSPMGPNDFVLQSSNLLLLCSSEVCTS